MAEFAPDDIRRPGLARDPGVRADFTPTLLTPTVDPTGKALQEYGADLTRASAAYAKTGEQAVKAASGQQQWAAQMGQLAQTFKAIRDEKQGEEDNLFMTELHLRSSQKATEDLHNMINSPDINKPDFPKLLDQRVRDSYKTIEEELLNSGQYIPSDAARARSQQRFADVRLSVGQRAVISAQDERLKVMAQGDDRFVDAVALKGKDSDTPYEALRLIDERAASIASRRSASEAATYMQAAKDKVLRAWADQQITNGRGDRAKAVASAGMGYIGETASKDDSTVYTASLAAGVPPLYMIANADIESKRKSGAVNQKSSASGFFQITDDTWRGLGYEGRAKDAPIEVQAEAAARLAKMEGEAFKSATGMEPTSTDRRLMHVLGQGKGIATLVAASKDPSTTFESLIVSRYGQGEYDKIVKANPSFVGKTVGQMVQQTNLEINGAMKRIEDAGTIVARDKNMSEMSLATHSAIMGAVIAQEAKDKSARDTLVKAQINEKLLNSKIGTGPMVTDEEIHASGLPLEDQVVLRSRNYEINKERIAQENFVKRFDAVSSFLADPTDKDTVARMNLLHAQRGGDMNKDGKVNETNNQMFFEKTGFMPEATGDRLYMMLRQNNPEIVQAALNEITSYGTAKSGAFDALPSDKKKVIQDAYYHNLTFGLSGDESKKISANRWIENQIPEVVQERKATKEDPVFKKNVEANTTTSALAKGVYDIGWFSNPLEWGTPNYSTMSVQRGLQGRFQDAYTELRMSTPLSVSDSEVQKLAIAQLRRAGVGISRMRGETSVALFAPDAHPQLVGNKTNWADKPARFIEEDVVEKMGEAVLRETGVTLRPTKDGVPANFILVPEVGYRTHKGYRNAQYGDARVTSPEAGADADTAFMEGQYKVPYTVIVLRADGRAEPTAPGRGYTLNIPDIFERNRKEHARKETERNTIQDNPVLGSPGQSTDGSIPDRVMSGGYSSPFDILDKSKMIPADSVEARGLPGGAEELSKKFAQSGNSFADRFFYEDGGTENMAIGEFLNRFVSNSPSTPKAKNLSSYPSDEDAAFARAYGFGYGSGNESHVNGEVARVLGEYVKGNFEPKTAVGRSLFDIMGAVHNEAKSKNINLLDPKNAYIADRLGQEYAKAALAVNRVPVAALGFDPSRVVVDTEAGKNNKVNIGGAYNEKLDSLYSNLSSPGTIVHESIHRGLKKLRKDPALKEVFDGLPSDEYITRYLMATQSGDPEKGSGDVGDAQRKTGIYFFTTGPKAEEYKKNLDIIERAAQDSIARQRERGPR